MTVSESLQACFCKQEDIKYVYYGYFFLTMNPYLFHLKLIMNFFVFFLFLTNHLSYVKHKSWTPRTVLYYNIFKTAASG